MSCLVLKINLLSSLVSPEQERHVRPWLGPSSAHQRCWRQVHGVLRQAQPQHLRHLHERTLQSLPPPPPSPGISHRQNHQWTPHIKTVPSGPGGLRAHLALGCAGLPPQGGPGHQLFPFSFGWRHQLAPVAQGAHALPQQQADAAAAGLAGGQRKDRSVCERVPRAGERRWVAHLAWVCRARQAGGAGPGPAVGAQPWTPGKEAHVGSGSAQDD